MSDTPPETPGADTASQAASRAAARAASHATRASARAAARAAARGGARPGTAGAAPAGEAAATAAPAAAAAADAPSAPAAAAAAATPGSNQAVHTATEALALVGRAVRGFSLPRLRMPRPRLLPGIMFVAALMVGVRTNDLVQGLTAEALDPGQPGQAQTAAPTPAAGDGAGADAPAAPEEGEPETLAALPPDERTLSDSERALLEGLSARRTALDDRERALDKRSALLAVAEQRLTEKTTELETLRSQIEAMIEVVDKEREAQLTNLVGIYENMRPGDAAAIFDGLDLEVLLDVLDRMREQKSAPILAKMNPARAREVTTELAQRQAFPTASN